jgi:hypothetical protein
MMSKLSLVVTWRFLHSPDCRDGQKTEHSGIWLIST